MAAVEPAENHGDEQGLTWYLRDHPNHHENSPKLCDKIGHPVLSLLESQWKLRQQHDHNFATEEKPLQNKY